MDVATDKGLRGEIAVHYYSLQLRLDIHTVYLLHSFTSKLSRFHVYYPTSNSVVALFKMKLRSLI